jgi:hypothetical protein
LVGPDAGDNALNVGLLVFFGAQIEEGLGVKFRLDIKAVWVHYIHTCGLSTGPRTIRGD